MLRKDFRNFRLNLKQTPIFWRRKHKKALIYAVLLFLVVFAYRLYLRPRKPPVFQSSEFIPMELTSFELQQNGYYWIFKNFLHRQHNQETGNVSITLTTHGTYKDFIHLEWLVVRWEGPISIAIYVEDIDFEPLLESIYYLKYCTAIGMSFLRVVSMHLIFHDKHLPKDLQQLSLERPRGMRCNAPFLRQLQNVTHFDRHDEVYPANLLQNVARLNAKTYFVFALELSLLPTKKFVGKFLQFAQQFQPAQQLKSVYCVPIFPQLVENQHMPKYKSELVDQLQPYLNQSRWLSAAEHQHLERMRHWLQKPLQDGQLTYFEITKDTSKCAAYVSINAYEPLFDQRYADTNFYANGSKQLSVLIGLNFDFVVLDGTFLIRRHFAQKMRKLPKQKDKMEVNSDVIDQIKLNNI